MIRLIDLLKESLNYNLIKRKAISNAKTKGYESDFINYLDHFYDSIQKDIKQIEKSYLNKKHNINGKNIIIKRIELSGSYSKGIPTPDSDVDVKIYYTGDVDPSDVAIEFAGQLGGDYGSYDAHAEKIS